MTDKISYRDTASFGKRQEYHVIGELLRRGYDVYQTLVDDQQIDCILRKGMNEPKYVDVQIKARSKKCLRKNAGRFPNLTIQYPRRNFVFIFYSEVIDTLWIIPSLDIVNELGYENKQSKSKNLGKWTINIAGFSKTENKAIWNGKTSKKFEKYLGKNGFKILDSILDG